MSQIFIFYLYLLLQPVSVQRATVTENTFQKDPVISIPAAGNSWVINDIDLNEKVITRNGIENWSENSTIIRTYFRTEGTGKIDIAFRGRVLSGQSSLALSFGGKSRTINISNTGYDTVSAGSFVIEKAGYQYIEIKGTSKSSGTFAGISDFLISGPAISGKVYYVKEDSYFGRRGPSVHLRYDLPKESTELEWFYNEITIPAGSDVIGSYFMANGFADGYFGIQVNSPAERRILFSVWSPYKTDNPGEIPEEYRITLLKKGKDVITKEFGNEGSGGQSYRVFNWKAGSTYRFLLKGHPSVNNSTDYSAYFFAPETGKWELIASFRRPKTINYLKSLYSFLENFMTETGPLERKGYYSNQWVCDRDGKWYELSDIKFTADATARKESRLDYSGGVENGMFFLRNCGFFSDMTRMDQTFSRPKTGKQPEIDFLSLE